MTHEWMIDVLADLRQYAIRNYYLDLAEQIDDAIVVAAVELRRARATDEVRGETRGRRTPDLAVAPEPELLPS